MPEMERILQACRHILNTAKEKLKEEANPLLIRIQSIIQEFQVHLLAIASNKDKSQLKYHWSVLYRDGDILDEMKTLLNNTTPVSIQTEVDYIKQCLIFFTQHVIQAFGKRESLYIITPKFQELSGIW